MYWLEDLREPGKMKEPSSEKITERLTLGTAYTISFFEEDWLKLTVFEPATNS